MDLKPAQLKPEPTREVRPADVTARDNPLSELNEAPTVEKRVQEHRPEPGQLREYRPDLKPEQDRSASLRAIRVTPVQVQQMRERRVTARPLGWRLPGSSLQVDASWAGQDQASSTNARS